MSAHLCEARPGCVGVCVCVRRGCVHLCKERVCVSVRMTEGDIVFECVY